MALTKVLNSVEQKRCDRISGPFICYRGLTLTQDKIDEWSKFRTLSLDGYASCTHSRKVAEYFSEDSYCYQPNKGEKEMVLLVIYMENESSKYYINLNRDDYTCYPDEKEVLLQAGLTAEV